MSLFAGFIVFIVGLIAGLAVSRFLPIASSEKNSELEQQVSNATRALDQYQHDVAEHLEQSAALLQQMNSTCQTAMEQMAQSTLLLKKATPKADHMPFFSEETQRHLAETAHRRPSKKSSADSAGATNPPLDYSSGSSGLFVDQKQSVTNAD